MSIANLVGFANAYGLWEIVWEGGGLRSVFVRLREEGFAGSVRVSVRECMHEGLGKKKEGRHKGAGKMKFFNKYLVHKILFGILYKARSSLF